jgi:hypothetical protein
MDVFISPEKQNKPPKKSQQNNSISEFPSVYHKTA